MANLQNILSNSGLDKKIDDTDIKIFFLKHKNQAALPENSSRISPIHSNKSYRVTSPFDLAAAATDEASFMAAMFIEKTLKLPNFFGINLSSNKTQAVAEAMELASGFFSETGLVNIPAAIKSMKVAAFMYSHVKEFAADNPLNPNINHEALPTFEKLSNVFEQTANVWALMDTQSAQTKFKNSIYQLSGNLLPDDKEKPLNELEADNELKIKGNVSRKI